jgi:hypothetical protein
MAQMILAGQQAEVLSCDWCKYDQVSDAVDACKLLTNCCRVDNGKQCSGLIVLCVTKWLMSTMAMETAIEYSLRA